MSFSTLSFSASLPPFYQTTGYNTNFSNTNSSTNGNVAITTTNDGATGQPQTTVNSSINSNGISYVENSATVTGNLLTVNYTSTNAADAAPDSGVARQLLNTNINGNGVGFSPQNSITNSGNVTTFYNTNPNNNYNALVSNAAYSTGSSDSNQTITLKSLAIVGNSITAVYELSSGGLPNNVDLAPHEAAPQPTLSTVSVVTPAPKDQLGPTFASKGVQSFGDVLAGANGLSLNGTLTGALQSGTNGQSISQAQPKSILAGLLNPSVNANASTSFSVTDFINTGQNAFPTSNANSAANAYNTANSYTSDNSNPFSSSSANSDSNYANYTGGGASYASGSYTSSSVSIYNSISNASASTIRGTGYSTVA